MEELLKAEAGMGGDVMKFCAEKGCMEWNNVLRVDCIRCQMRREVEVLQWNGAEIVQNGAE